MLRKPVVRLAPEPPALFPTVLLPVAHDPHPERAVMALRQLLASLEVAPPDVVALHVGAGEPPTVRAPSGWVVETRRGEGPVVQAILDTARGEPADLIVMATKGHDTALDALRGSTVERVLRMARRPVLVVPG